MFKCCVVCKFNMIWYDMNLRGRTVVGSSSLVGCRSRCALSSPFASQTSPLRRCLGACRIVSSPRRRRRPHDRSAVTRRVHREDARLATSHQYVNVTWLIIVHSYRCYQSRRRWGAGLTPLHDANQPHQSPSRPCVNERNDVFGVERSDLVIRTKQLASSNTVYIFMYSYLQLSISFPKTDTHTFLSLPLSLIPPQLSTSPCMFVVPRRQSDVANYTSLRRPTVNHLSTPRRPNAAMAPTLD